VKAEGESPRAAPTTTEAIGATTPARRAGGSRVAKLYTPSQKAKVIEYASAHGVTAASKEFEISRFSIYDWQRKVVSVRRSAGVKPAELAGRARQAARGGSHGEGRERVE